VPVRIRRSAASAESGRRTRRFLVENIDRCVGCYTCEVACQQEHGEKRIRLLTIGPAIGPTGETSMEQIVLATDACDLCSELACKGIAPACVRACPTHALAAASETSAVRLLHKGRHHVCSAIETLGFLESAESNE